jgi:hypothetical protein
MCACGAVEEECKFIGVTLLAHQANKQLNYLDAYEKNALDKTSSNKWALLQKGAMIQSQRVSQSQKGNLKNKSLLTPKQMESATKVLHPTVTPTPRICCTGQILPNVYQLHPHDKATRGCR